jgi:hypothetical protein
MSAIVGRLPLEIGNLTELEIINISRGDFSAGPVPDSIRACSHLKSFTLFKCNFQAEFPSGLEGLKSLGLKSFGPFSNPLETGSSRINQLGMLSGVAGVVEIEDEGEEWAFFFSEQVLITGSTPSRLRW